MNILSWVIGSSALPITERTPVPFASKVKSTYNGQEVGVMHACGQKMRLSSRYV